MLVKVDYFRVMPCEAVVEVDDKYKPLATDSFADFNKLPPELFNSFIKDIENTTEMPIGDDDIREDDLDINTQLEKRGFYDYITAVEDIETHCIMAEW